MNLRHIVAIFKKQMCDNKKILIQFLIYPVIVLVFIFAPGKDNSTKMTITALMSSMLIGIAPLISINDIIREDKRTGALRMLILSNVKPHVYLFGVTSFIGICSIATTIMIGSVSGLDGKKLLCYLACMIAGCILTIAFGSTMACCVNDSSSSVFVILLSMLNGFLPIMAKFYPAFSVVSKYWYTQVISDIIYDLYDGFYDNIPFRFAVLAITAIIFFALFCFSFKKNKLISHD